MHDVLADGRNNSAVFRSWPPVIRTAKMQMLTHDLTCHQSSIPVLTITD